MTDGPKHDNLPELPLEAWEESKITLHLYAQIVGKIRLALHPKLNHWWHASLYLSPRGFTTHAIPTGNGLIDLELDFLDHKLLIRSSNGQQRVVPLYDGLSVAAFYRGVLSNLKELGVEVDILAKPFDPARVGSEIPFAEDEMHARYDPEMVTRFWRVLGWAYTVFALFKGRFYGKSTPVHFFWHSFDLAYSKFSGRRAPEQAAIDPVTREAYSHELASFGFWPGDANLRAPAFYAYAYPEPEGYRDAPVQPEEAFYSKEMSEFILPYEAVRRARQPDAALLAFLESTYRAAATLARWDLAALERRPA
jgi:hypothetical protein